MSDEDNHEEELIGVEGGNAKYVLAGLLLFGLAGLAYVFGIRQPEAPTAPTAQTQPAAEPPPNVPAYADDFAIAEEEPDAGAQAAEPATRPNTGGAARASDWSSCTGEIASAQTAFRSYGAEVRTCYERKLRSDPMLQGSLRVQLKIGSGGTVQGVQVGGSMRDSDVVSCVRERARAWRFPAPTGGSCAVVAAPFSLTPRQ